MRSRFVNAVRARLLVSATPHGAADDHHSPLARDLSMRTVPRLIRTTVRQRSPGPLVALVSALTALRVAPLAAQSAALPASPPVSANAALHAASNATPPSRGDWHLTLTIFRSPGTGLQLARGPLAVFVAHYPTVIKRDGAQRGTQFIRAGVAAYLRDATRTAPYVSLSVAPSLTRGWTTSGLVDVGVRQRFTTRLSGQLGVALLHAPRLDATRVNPTVGLGVRF
jgi:hypothetical protein